MEADCDEMNLLSLFSLADGDLAAPINLLKNITAAGGTVMLAVGAWLVHKGIYRHAREFIEQEAASKRALDAKQAELDRERVERERERKETDRAMDRIQGELNTTNQQLLSVLETGKRSQVIAKQTLDLAAGNAAQNSQADRP